MKIGVTSGQCGAGRFAICWRLDNEAWQLDGIELPPRSESLVDVGVHPDAGMLAQRLAKPLTRQDWELPEAAPAGLSEFQWLVLSTLHRRVPAGRVVTYGGLAHLVGRHGAARAVGTAMRGNPFPLLIPCHRVIAADRRLGGFQGNCAGANERKYALLKEEGVEFEGDRVATRAVIA